MIAIVGAGIFFSACHRPDAATSLAPESTPNLLTTSGALAADNVQAELAQAERLHAERPADVGRARSLVDRLLLHAQYWGQLADYDRALAIAMSLPPTNAAALLVRAHVWSALHQFPRALAAVDEAELTLPPREASFEQAEKTRVSIWQATGRLDDAIKRLQAWRRDRPTLATFGAEATAYAEARDFTRAASLFEEAKRHYNDVSPFAVAWLEFQEGHMWEGAGRSDLARAAFASAHARLPIYAAATAHLAGTLATSGDPASLAQARALLEPLVARSDDPEYIGQLAAVQRRLGHADEAERLTREATEMYEGLLSRHPEAFEDHAARFFLRVVGDPRRALALAEKNLTLRQTPEARDLCDEARRAVAVAAVIPSP